MNGSNFGRIPALLIWSNMWKKSSRILAKNIKLILYRHLALCDQLRLTLWPLSNDRAEGMFTIPDRLKGRLDLALGQLHLRQRAQVKMASITASATFGHSA